MRPIGLHLPIEDSLTALIQKALRLGISCFQCFLVKKKTYKPIDINPEDLFNFLRIRNAHFDKVYAHGSCRINLSSCNRIWHPALKQELALAKKLGCTHFILHAGSVENGKKREDGINALARTLNIALKREHVLHIVLENTAHSMSIGSDISDFELLLKKLDQPDKVSFCIDTAHAHSYGYDIHNREERNTFIDMICESLGCDAISLIHLNDTAELLGSNIDKHALIGDRENQIGNESLRSFIFDPRIIHVPLVMELPPNIAEIEMMNVVQDVCMWHNL